MRPVRMREAIAEVMSIPPLPPASKLVAKYRVPKGLLCDATSDVGLPVDVAHIPRKGARRASMGMESIEVLPGATDFVAQHPHDDQDDVGNEGGGLMKSENHEPGAPAINPETIHNIRSLHREHRSLQRAVGDMTRRIMADERWFAVARMRAAGEALPAGKFPDVKAADKAMVILTRQRFFLARAEIEVHRRACQKELIALVKHLPIAKWVATVKGLGLPSVAAVIGEAGDLHGYATVARLWKRMGLAVIDGKGQGKRANLEEATKHGYNPRRRSEMHVVGDCLVRAGGPYADLYRERKAYEAEREGITKMHAHKRALRYIEKRLLREMWAAWRGGENAMQSFVRVPLADELTGQYVHDTHDAIAGQRDDQSLVDIHIATVVTPPIP